MDFDLSSNRSRTTVPVPPAMALAVATIVAAGVAGLAVAGLTWTLDRPADRATGAPPDAAAFERTPEPSATGPIDTPGWAEALGLPAPDPVPSGPTAGVAPAPVAGVGTAAQPNPGQEEVSRRAAAARRAPIGPTATAVRSSTPNAGAASVAAPPSAAPSVSGPGADTAPDPTAFDSGAADPAAVEVPPTVVPTVDPTPTETSDPADDRRTWNAPRRNPPREQPPAPDTRPWSGPFDDFPRLFPWG